MFANPYALGQSISVKPSADTKSETQHQGTLSLGRNLRQAPCSSNSRKSFYVKPGFTVKKWRRDNVFLPFVIMRYQKNAQDAQEFAANFMLQMLA